MAPPDRSRRVRPREVALALLAFALLGALPIRAALFDGDTVLCAVDTASVQLPFSAAAGIEPGEGPQVPSLSDQGMVFYPAYRHVTRRVARGELPLWNPYLYAGAPLVGNPQLGALDPQVLALALLRRVGGIELFDRGFAYLAWLRLAGAGLGAYLLARALRLSGPSSAFAGVAFAGSGVLALWVGNPVGHVAPFLPWILLALEGIRGERPARATLAAALLLCAAILGGHPEAAFFVGATAGLFALAILREDRTAGVRGLVALALGTLLAAPSLAPFVEYMLRSGAMVARSAIEPPAVDFLGLGAVVLAIGIAVRVSPTKGASAGPRVRVPVALGLGLVFAAAVRAVAFPPEAALALLPERFGWPATGGYRGPGELVETACVWSPAIALAAALAGLLPNRDAGGLKYRGPIAAIAVTATLLALATPGWLDVFRWIPFVGLAAPARIAVVASLGVALVGAHALEHADRGARLAAVVALGAVLVGLELGATAPVTAPTPRAFPDPSDEVVVFAARPPIEIEAGRVELAGFVHPSLPVGAMSVRVERVDPGGAHEPVHALGLPVELDTAVDGAWRAERDLPAGARAFRASFLDVSRLPEGTWRFVLELRGADGAPMGERVAGVSSVLRPPTRGGAHLVFWIVALAVLAAVPPRRVAWIAVLLAASQATWFARGLHPAVPRERCFPPTKTEAVLERVLAGRRYLSDPGVLPPDTGMVRGLACLGGYDALDPASFNAFRPFAQRPGAHPLLGWNASGVDLESPAFRLFGVGALVTRAPLVHPGWELVAGPAGAPESAEVWVQRARDPLPRAFCVADVRGLDELDDPRDFDPLAVAFVERDEPWRPAAPFTRADVAVDAWRDETIELSVALDGDGLLLVTEQFFPGWRASVDGEPAPIVRTNAIFRGVPLAAGEHVVRLEYAPGSLRLGLFLAAAGVAGLALVAFAATRGARGSGGGGATAPGPTRA